MEPKIASLDIRQFRALRQFKVEGLGRVNLLTGRNNTGKSSVLEAIRILASDAAPSVLYRILHFREEDVGEFMESPPPLDAEGMFELSNIFHGFPQFSGKLDPIMIASSGRQRPMRLSLSAGWFSEEREQDGSRRLIPQEQEIIGEREVLPGLVIEAGVCNEFFRWKPCDGMPIVGARYGRRLQVSHACPVSS